MLTYTYSWHSTTTLACICVCVIYIHICILYIFVCFYLFVLIFPTNRCCFHLMIIAKINSNGLNSHNFSPLLYQSAFNLPYFSICSSLVVFIVMMTRLALTYFFTLKQKRNSATNQFCFPLQVFCTFEWTPSTIAVVLVNMSFLV